VTALGIVHAQGLVHGGLTGDCVMTHGDEEPDFQLTGFEWSLWLTADKAERPLSDLMRRGFFVLRRRLNVCFAHASQRPHPRKSEVRRSHVGVHVPRYSSARTAGVRAAAAVGGLRASSPIRFEASFTIS